MPNLVHLTKDGRSNPARLSHSDIGIQKVHIRLLSLVKIGVPLRLMAFQSVIQLQLKKRLYKALEFLRAKNP